MEAEGLVVGVAQWWFCAEFTPSFCNFIMLTIELVSKYRTTANIMIIFVVSRDRFDAVLEAMQNPNLEFIVRQGL